MMTVDFTSSPDIPTASACSARAASMIASTGCLIPRLTTRKPLLVRMMSTRFLPMSCTSPFTVASTMVPLALPSLFSMWGSKKETAAFMVWADCNTKGNCISPLPNSSPTTRIPSSSSSLMMCSGV